MPPYAKILLLTFSNQARVQLEVEAARQLSSRLRARIEVTNYHRFFWHAVLSYRRALGLPMNVEIVSRRRRLSAIQRDTPAHARFFRRREVLLDALAEYRFPDFRDERTPPIEILEPVLGVVSAEQRAGRLVFDDLGALFWELLNRFPAVETAYRVRYPVVVADEHQDASALQDAVVRRLASVRLVIFADPMQLIHGFRGADPRRLEQHLTECDGSHTLSTPHRWHGNVAVGTWLLAVRRRLEGTEVEMTRPPSFHLVLSPGGQGLNGTLLPTRLAVLRAFGQEMRTVAVLARTNDDVTRARNYLSRVGLHPRQIGSTDDFEDARELIDRLSCPVDSRGLARLALGTVSRLVPTITPATWRQVNQRLGAREVNVRSAGRLALPLLRAVEPLYGKGPGYLFAAVAAALEVCEQLGHHVPRLDTVRAIRGAAESLGDEPELEEALRTYSQRVVAAMHAAPRLGPGLFVMTTHQAKGKEFDAIVLTNATRRNFPDDTDSRKLFYVAVTRATSDWTLIAPADDVTPLARHLF